MIITAEFGTGIQLGFGFTLIGVGGLLGLNRTMNLRAADGGRPHRRDQQHHVPARHRRERAAHHQRPAGHLPAAAGHVPDRPDGEARLGHADARSASRSASSSRSPATSPSSACSRSRCRPTTPALVAAGQLRRRDRVRQASALYFFAALFESRILFMTLDGEMGLLVAVGDDANFVVSVGGFHPRSQPPPLPFPSPEADRDQHPRRATRRASAPRPTSRSRRTRCSSAPAPSCSSASASFSVEGHLALRRAVPVLAVLLHHRGLGVGLAEGLRHRPVQHPARPHARGTDAVARARHGSISLLFFSISARLRQDLGRRAATRSCRRSRCCRCSPASSTSPRTGAPQLPPQSNAARRRCASSDPAATRRRAAPARLAAGERSARCRSSSTIDKVGNQRPTDANRFSLDVAGGGLAKVADANEQFAPAQFLDHERRGQALAARRSSRCTGGIDLAVQGQPHASAHAVAPRRPLRGDHHRHELPPLRSGASAGSPACSSTTSSPATRRASARSRSRGKGEREPFGDGVAVRGETYAVASTADNRRGRDDRSRARRRRATSSPAASRPTRRLANELHVIPAFEAAAA